MKGLMVSLIILLGISCGLVSRGADFDGDSRADIAIFRPSTGLWSVRGITRIYFGQTGDSSIAGDYDGDGIAEVGIFRGSSGLWAVRGITRVYYGESSDKPVRGGSGGQILYDYVVKKDDGADLVRALESDTYRSVFIPAGTYSVSETITVDNVRQITGGRHFATIDFTGSYYLSIQSDHCVIERIRVRNGGSVWYGNFVINDADHVTVRDCRSVDSTTYGFDGYGAISTSSDYLTFINCVARNAAYSGFRGNSATENTHLIACTALGCSPSSGYASFKDFYNVTGCFVDGLNNIGGRGFQGCINLSSCQAVDCRYAGYDSCQRVSACTALGDGSTSTYGFRACSYVAASYASGCTNDWDSNNHTAACNDVP